MPTLQYNVATWFAGLVWSRVRKQRFAGVHLLLFLTELAAVACLMMVELNTELETEDFVAELQISPPVFQAVCVSISLDRVECVHTELVIAVDVMFCLAVITVLAHMVSLTAPRSYWCGLLRAALATAVLVTNMALLVYVYLSLAGVWSVHDGVSDGNVVVTVTWGPVVGHIISSLMTIVMNIGVSVHILSLEKVYRINE